MTQNVVTIPLTYFNDPDSSRALSGAQIYVGVPDLDPEVLANRYTIYLILENGTSVPVSPSEQPVSTGSGGTPTYNGSVAQIRVGDPGDDVSVNYSIKILDKGGSQKYYWPNVYDGLPLSEGSSHNLLGDRDAADCHPSSSITHDPYGGVSNTVEDILQIHAHVDSYPTLQDALNTGLDIDITGADIDLGSSGVTMQDGQRLYGKGIIRWNSGYAITASGSVASEVDLDLAITDFTNQIVLTDASSFNPGEICRLISTIDCLSTDAGSLQLGIATGSQISYFSEYVEIASIVNGTIFLNRNTTFNNYPLTAGSTTPSGRQISVLQKINFVKIYVDSQIEFICEGNSSGAIKVDYGYKSNVDRCSFNFDEYTGSAVRFDNSLKCNATYNSYYLKSDTPMNYLGNNPTAEDYFNFNAFKHVSSQECVFYKNEISGSSQSMDVTYGDAPCINCEYQSNTLINARVNAFTTHSGSIGTVMHANTAFNCERGPSIRSRAEKFTSNVIVNTRDLNISPTTGTNSYGLAITEGFNVNDEVKENTIQGYYRALIRQNSEGGFPYYRLDIHNNNFYYCTRWLDFQTSSSIPDYVNDTNTGLSIRYNSFRSNDQFTSPIVELLSQYTHNVLISDNEAVDDQDSASSYYFEIANNCKNTQIVNNRIGSVGRLCTVGGITDTGTLGPNTIENINLYTSNNYRNDGSREMDAFVDGVNAGDNGASCMVSNSVTEVLTADTSEINVFGRNKIFLGNSSGADIVIDNLTNGVPGQTVELHSASETAGASIYLSNSATSGGNIVYSGSSTEPNVQLQSTRMVILSYRPSSQTWIPNIGFNGS